MKVLYVLTFFVAGNFPMEMGKKELALLAHENNITKTEYTPLINMDHVTIEIPENHAINDIDDTEEPEKEEGCCKCTKTQAVVIGSIVTTTSVMFVAFMTGLTTIIVALINHK